MQRDRLLVGVSIASSPRSSRYPVSRIFTLASVLGFGQQQHLSTPLHITILSPPPLSGNDLARAPNSTSVIRPQHTTSFPVNPN